MKKLNWQISLSVLLVLLSAVLYCCHYLIFKDTHHIFIYMIGDIAFVPIEVLLVTVIIHQLLDIREKQVLLKKMNMVIGTFFSEVGTDLLKIMSSFDKVSDSLHQTLIIKKDCTEKQFKQKLQTVQAYAPEIAIARKDLVDLNSFLMKHRSFLLRLLENQNLLEHETFTDLMWAVFHLTEELETRTDLENIADNDMQHLIGDFQRVYKILIIAWLAYMKHLKADYPFLFSFAMRTNPFDAEATPEFK